MKSKFVRVFRFYLKSSLVSMGRSGAGRSRYCIQLRRLRHTDFRRLSSSDPAQATIVQPDGKTDSAVYRNGVWHAWSSVNGWKYLNMGQSGDQPMVGNFADEPGDLEDWAVRGVRSRTIKWFVRDGWTVFNPDYPTNEVPLPGEQAADKPVVGDFNGDGRDDLGYFHDGFWYTADARNLQAPRAFQWGLAGDIPIPAQSLF